MLSVCHGSRDKQEQQLKSRAGRTNRVLGCCVWALPHTVVTHNGSLPAAVLLLLLSAVLQEVRSADTVGPVLVHVITEKGRGYLPAETAQVGGLVRCYVSAAVGRDWSLVGQGHQKSSAAAAQEHSVLPWAAQLSGRGCRQPVTAGDNGRFSGAA